MTIQQLRQAIDDFAAIKCSSTEERNNVLRFLNDLGYELGPTTGTYITDQCKNDDRDYLCPAKDPNEHYVTVYLNETYANGDVIYYDDIARLIEDGVEDDGEEDTAELIAAFGAMLIVPPRVDPPDPFAGMVINTHGRREEIDGRNVVRTIRRKNNYSEPWIVKLAGVRAYQEVFEHEILK